MRRIILASTSPRRRELMAKLGLDFEVHAPHFQEISDFQLAPEEEVQHFAHEKARSLRDDFPDALILGSDTLVELDGRKMGKPVDAADAVRMLSALSGRSHRVLTALALLDTSNGECRESLEIAEVRMRVLSLREIRDYVDTGEPMDKAGAYALQGLGGRVVDAVEGDYFTVVGLPLRKLWEMLRDFGVVASSVL